MATRRSASPSASAITPAVYALSVVSFCIWLVVFICTIVALAAPYYTLPLTESDGGGNVLGTLTTCFGLTSATCCGSSGVFTSSGSCSSTATSYATAQTELTCGPTEVNCLALLAAYASAVSLGSAAIAVYVISLVSSFLAATAAAILVARARGWLAPGSGGLSSMLANNLVRTFSGWLCFILTGCGVGLGANAASVVWAAIYNYYSGVGYGFGAAGTGLGLGALACLLAFIGAVIDDVVICGCCCARVSPSGVVDFSGSRVGSVVVANAADVAARASGGSRPSAKA